MYANLSVAHRKRGGLLRLRRKLTVTAILVAIVGYALTPAMYAAAQGFFSADLYVRLLKTNPVLWPLAAETIKLSPEGRGDETAYVLSLTPADEWDEVRQAVLLFEQSYMPFTPPSESLRQHYVDPNPISGEEPVRDWRYIVYLVAVRLVMNVTSVYKAGSVLCSWVHGYITYDWRFWHRESPIKLLVQRRGTCTNFSILLVALCRAVGIPARLVRDNSFGTETHAWSEFYVEGKGWVHADASAGYFDKPRVYGLETFHLVKAYDPLEGWINITPRYTSFLGTIRGHVVLHDEPVEGALVSLYVPWNLGINLLRARTNQMGLFSFVVANGTYILKASHERYTADDSITVEVNQVKHVTLALD